MVPVRVFIDGLGVASVFRIPGTGPLNPDYDSGQTVERYFQFTK